MNLSLLTFSLIPDVLLRKKAARYRILRCATFLEAK